MKAMGIGYEEENGAGSLCLEEYYWGSDGC